MSEANRTSTEQWWDVPAGTPMMFCPHMCGMSVPKNRLQTHWGHCSRVQRLEFDADGNVSAVTFRVP